MLIYAIVNLSGLGLGLGLWASEVINNYTNKFLVFLYLTDLYLIQKKNSSFLDFEPLKMPKYKSPSLHSHLPQYYIKLTT